MPSPPPPASDNTPPGREFVFWCGVTLVPTMAVLCGLWFWILSGLECWKGCFDEDQARRRDLYEAISTLAFIAAPTATAVLVASRRRVIGSRWAWTVVVVPLASPFVLYLLVNL